MVHRLADGFRDLFLEVAVEHVVLTLEVHEGTVAVDALAVARGIEVDVFLGRPQLL